MIESENLDKAFREARKSGVLDASHDVYCRSENRTKIETNLDDYIEEKKKAMHNQFNALMSNGICLSDCKMAVATVVPSEKISLSLGKKEDNKNLTIVHEEVCTMPASNEMIGSSVWTMWKEERYLYV